MKKFLILLIILVEIHSSEKSAGNDRCQAIGCHKPISEKDNNAIMLPCKHLIHHGCLQEWQKITEDRCIHCPQKHNFKELILQSKERQFRIRENLDIQEDSKTVNSRALLLATSIITIIGLLGLC